MDTGARDHKNKTPKDLAKERKWQDVHLYLKHYQTPSKKNRPVSVSNCTYCSTFSFLQQNRQFNGGKKNKLTQNRDKRSLPNAV